MVDHPLVQHKLGLLRDAETPTQIFRQLVNELALLLTYEATKDLAIEEVEIETPLERTTVPRISGKKVAVCPILRAGIGMLDGVLSLIPAARVGFIGLYRNEETLQPVEYYVKLPADIAERDVILLDPMLATGNSTSAAVEMIKRAGAQSMRLIADHRRARGDRAPARGPSGRARRRRRDRPGAQRARLHRPRARRRRRPAVRHEVTAERHVDTFTANLDVLWGFLVAFAIVLVLTPAVGRVARVLGVVDEPGEQRRMHLRAVPRLGGVAIFLGIFVPALAFLDLSGAYRGILLGAAVATAVGMVDDFRGLPWWAKLGGQGAAAGIADPLRRLHRPLQLPVPRRARAARTGSPCVVTFIWIIAMMNMVNLLDGMDGLAAGICAIAGRTFAVLALSLGRPEAAVLSAIVCRRLPRLPAPQLLPGADLHGRLGVAPARVHARRGGDPGLAEDGGDGRADLPADRPRHADPRHVVRGRQAPEVRPAAARADPLAPLPPLPQPRLLPAPGGALLLRLGRSCWPAAAIATRFVPFRSHGEWHLWPTVLVATIGLVVLAASLYMVYVLEILKVRRVRAWADRRRADEPDEEQTLKSA